MEEIDIKVLYFLNFKLLVGNKSGSISFHVLTNYQIPILPKVPVFPILIQGPLKICSVR